VDDAVEIREANGGHAIVARASRDAAPARLDDSAGIYALAEAAANVALASGLSELLDPVFELAAASLTATGVGGAPRAAKAVIAEPVDVIARRVNHAGATELEVKAAVANGDKQIVARLVFRYRVAIGEALTVPRPACG
jgi:hypothetical protein